MRYIYCFMSWQQSFGQTIWYFNQVVMTNGLFVIDIFQSLFSEQISIQNILNTGDLNLWPFHSKQRERKANDMDDRTHLQLDGTGDRFQQPSEIDGWQKWLQDSASKLLQLRVIWGVFKRLQIVDDSVHLQSILQSLQSSWEQSQQSPKRGFDMKIRTAHGSYLIEMGVRIYSLKFTSDVMSKHR